MALAAAVMDVSVQKRTYASVWGECLYIYFNYSEKIPRSPTNFFLSILRCALATFSFDMNGEIISVSFRHSDEVFAFAKNAEAREKNFVPMR